MTLEEFLRTMPVVNIVGGSQLYTGMPEHTISINGLREGAVAAAVNSTKQDERRVKSWSRVLVPNPQAEHKYPDHWMLPADLYAGHLPDYLRWHAQPTTCFCLLVICNIIQVKVNLYGVCGWASKWHDGDWEMHYIKRRFSNVTVHDPRPHW